MKKKILGSYSIVKNTCEQNKKNTLKNHYKVCELGARFQIKEPVIWEQKVD